MRFNPQAGLINEPESKKSRRRAARIPLEWLHCSLGAVLDVSATGMRITSKQAPPDNEFEIEIRDMHDALTVRATVVWCRRIGLRKREMGLSFLDIDPVTARRLTAIATSNRRRQDVA